MRASDYKRVINFLGDKGKGYAIIKKEQPVLYDVVQNRLLDCDIIFANGFISDYGNYTLSSMLIKKNANSIIVRDNSLSTNEKLLSHVVLASKLYAAAEHKKESIKRRKSKILERLEKEEVVSFKSKSVPKAPLRDKNKTPKENYDVFLNSNYWKYVRDLKIATSGGKCQICGCRKGLNVHHNTYAHHYNEHLHLEDLVVLCSKCHEKFHNIVKQQSNT